MSWIGLGGCGEAPCWYTGDHHWRGGGICAECGERLRCVCGRFVTVDGFDAHLDRCPVALKAPEWDPELEPA